MGGSVGGGGLGSAYRPTWDAPTLGDIYKEILKIKKNTTKKKKKKSSKK